MWFDLISQSLRIKSEMGPKPDLAAIYETAAPMKTAARYDREWEDFLVYIGQDDPLYEPVEADFAQYFFHLHTDRDMQVSTLWSRYSRLNNTYQRK